MPIYKQPKNGVIFIAKKKGEPKNAPNAHVRLDCAVDRSTTK